MLEYFLNVLERAKDWTETFSDYIYIPEVSSLYPVLREGGQHIETFLHELGFPVYGGPMCNTVITFENLAALRKNMCRPRMSNPVEIHGSMLPVCFLG